MPHDLIKGRGAQHNTPNRFSQIRYTEAYLEALDEPLERHPQRQLIPENPKSILSKSNSPDIKHVYSINPYRGCEHGCVYCYARNSHEYWGYSAGLDFETKIMVKSEAPRLLEQTFIKKSWQPQVIMLSGNTDCYQPLERELELTRQLLQVFLRYGNPVSIITKNTLIARDMDLLQALATRNLLHVWFSINSLDEALRSKLEPRTARASKRLAVMETFSAAGIPCGVMVAPVIPGLNDHEIPQVMRQASEVGALAAGYTLVRLNGAIGPLFRDWITKAFPDRADKVLNLIKETHSGTWNDSQFGRRMKGSGKIADTIAQLFQIAHNRYFSDRCMPAYCLDHFTRGNSQQLSLDFT